MALIQWIIAHAGELWAILASVVTVASLIVKLTPSPKDDAFLAKVIGFLSMIALNKK